MKIKASSFFPNISVAHKTGIVIFLESIRMEGNLISRHCLGGGGSPPSNILENSKTSGASYAKLCIPSRGTILHRVGTSERNSSFLFSYRYRFFCNVTTSHFRPKSAKSLPKFKKSNFKQNANVRSQKTYI